MSSRGGIRTGSGRKLLSPRSRLVSKEKKQKTKKRWEDEHRKLYVAADVHASWKKLKCMCLYSTDTAFAQHLSKHKYLTNTKGSRPNKDVLERT